MPYIPDDPMPYNPDDMLPYIPDYGPPSIPDLDFNGDISLDVIDANDEVQHFSGQANMVIKLEGTFDDMYVYPDGEVPAEFGG